MKLVPCPGCGTPTPEARLALRVSNGVCAECNKHRPRRTWMQGAVGFKNNGASVMPTEAHREFQKDNKVRG